MEKAASGTKVTDVPSTSKIHENNGANHNDGIYDEFFRYVRSGDWNNAKEFINSHPDAIRAKEFLTGRTVLALATRMGYVPIVEELVKLMTEDDLEIQNIWGWIPFHEAARTDINMVRWMVQKNKNILNIAAEGKTAIVLAADSGRWDVVRYLYSLTQLEDLTPQKGPYGAALLYSSLSSKQFDIAWELIERCPQLVITRSCDLRLPLSALICQPSAFPSTTRLNFWQRLIYNCIHIKPTPAINDIRVNVENQPAEEGNKKKDIASLVVGLLQGLISRPLRLLGINYIFKMKLFHVRSVESLDRMCEVIKNINSIDLFRSGIYELMFDAAERGNSELFPRLWKANPELLWRVNSNKKTIFQVAVECRQEKVYSLIYGLTADHKKVIANAADDKNNSVVHLAAVLSPSAKLDHISGGALQMQRELQWFKELESLSPLCLEYSNTDEKKPGELFTESHKELMKEGEMWMKDTATSCTVVGALIITMMFATAFAIPGGNNGDTGLPIFIEYKLFMVFIISAAVSLFSSTTSVLMFLGILTSRYAKEDFLKSLPTKMIIGLTTLFISIAAMMVTFCSALFLVVPNKSWIVMPVVSLASVPVTLFVFMQFPLLVEIFISTYGRGIFDREGQALDTNF